jgi:hypothetical protein
VSAEREEIEEQLSLPRSSGCNEIQEYSGGHPFPG